MCWLVESENKKEHCVVCLRSCDSFILFWTGFCAVVAKLILTASSDGTGQTDDKTNKLRKV